MGFYPRSNFNAETHPPSLGSYGGQEGVEVLSNSKLKGGREIEDENEDEG